MSRIACVALMGALSVIQGLSQGSFLFKNDRQPTRVGSMDGPLAGPDYWGRMLVGSTEISLVPIGSAIGHSEDGTIGGLLILTVPGMECLQTAYIQMVAWDGRAWGNDLASVPESQLGRTDTVEHILACEGDPVSAPRFTRPAVVPLVPEPSSIALIGLGGWALLMCRRHRRE